MTETRPLGVLDASALLAYLLGEPGSEVVERALIGGLVMSAVNLAEVLAWFAEHGEDPLMTYEALKARGIVNGLVQIEPFVEADVPEVARLRPLTKAIGLSLGDRACLALGRKLGLPVFTADRAWENAGVTVEVRLVR